MFTVVHQNNTATVRTANTDQFDQNFTDASCFVANNMEIQMLRILQKGNIKLN